MERTGAYRAGWWAAGLGALSLLLHVLAVRGHSVLAPAARAFAPDGELSAPFLAQLLRGQQMAGLCGFLAAPLLLYGDRPARRIAAWLAAGSDRGWAAFLFLLAAGGALFMQEVLFDGIPHVTDAVSHLFEAKILALGRLTVPHPPCPEAFDHEHVVMTLDGRWFTKYTPGHPLLLALGVVSGLLKFVVPACSGLATVFLVALAVPLLGRVASRVAGLLFAASPLALLLGGSFMSHTTFLACVLGGGVALARALAPLRQGTGRRGWAVVAGLAWGWAAITRPQDFLLAAALAGLAILLAGRLWAVLRLLPLLVVGAAVPLAFLLFWNQRIYGTAFALGYGFTSSGFRTPMYQATIGLSEQFPLAKAVAITGWTWLRLNGALFGWPVSLLFVPWALLGRDHRRVTWWCLAACAVFAGVYFFYSYYGAEYEARYYCPLLPPLIVLTALGLRHALRRPAGAALATWLLALSAGYALAHYWPHRIWPAYHGGYEQVSRAVERQARSDGLARALVLMPTDPAAPLQYPAGFQFNDPLLKADVLYARDLPEQLECLQAAFPDRQVVRLTLDEGGLRLVPVSSPPAPARDQAGR